MEIQEDLGEEGVLEEQRRAAQLRREGESAWKKQGQRRELTEGSGNGNPSPAGPTGKWLLAAKQSLQVRGPSSIHSRLPSVGDPVT